MHDRALAAAIAAGDPDGIADAYDRYAASLYARCRSVLPDPGAAGAMLDTFLIAVARLDGLADPDRLEAWLYAVARNECLRLLGPEGAAAAGPAGPGTADPDDELPAVTLPVDLRSTVVAACTDNSPAGRARRMSAAHRAGPFGPNGFPKAFGASGPPWWQPVRRHPRVAATIAVLTAVAMSAGITMVMTAGGAHRPQASAALGLGAGAVAGSASSAAPGSPSAAPSPIGKASLSPSTSAPPVTPPGGTPSPAASAVRGTPSSPVPPSAAASRPSPSPPAPPTPPPPPSHGYLLLAPDQLMLTSAKGTPATGSFVLTAVNGPVGQYTINVPAAMAGKVSVSPSAGSLPEGGFVEVTVTVTSKSAVNTDLTVEPGNLTVRVMFKITKD